MADRGDTHYFTPTLHKWFAGSSILLMATVVWMVLDDHAAQWKLFQREFFELERQKAEERLAEADMRAAAQAEEELLAALAERQAELEDIEKELSEARETLRILKGDRDAAIEAEKMAKQNFNWEKYEFNTYLSHHPDEVPGDAGYDAAAAELTETEDILNARTVERERQEALFAEQQAVVDGMMVAVAQAEADAKAAVKGLDLVRNKLDSLAPEDVPGRIANLIRDEIPGLDFVGPNIKVQKVVLPDLSFELNFTKGQRIDMCTTCHMASENRAYLAADNPELEHPHLAHPRLDLFLSAKSPHPYNEVGCTICHRGSGQALDFTRADHYTRDMADSWPHAEEGSPDADTQAQEWYDEYHWHKQHHWDYPMLSAEHIEASCVQCHTDSMELIADDAPVVTEGFRNFERYGCYACHKVEWFPTKRKPGPSLVQMWQKLSPEFVANWIAHPKDFRPTTWMPQVFHLENFAEDEVVARANWGNDDRDITGGEWNDNAVFAITKYLETNHRETSEPLPPIPVAGDALAGREAFRLSGCLSCHNVAPWGDDPEALVDGTGYVDPARLRRDENEHGPNLRGVATKIEQDWLYWWLKDPTAYWHETRMPNLRLTDQDAADITAYIMEDPDGYFTDVPDTWSVDAGLPEHDVEVLREQARWFFQRDGRAVVNTRFENEWADTDVLAAAVGEKFVMHQGCYSCHEVAGHESDMPIGAELTEWASKTVDKLDFGMLPHIFAHRDGWDHDREHQFKMYHDLWLEQKLNEPRSFDREQVKNPLERLRMPYFGFDDQQVQEISSFVLGLVADEVQNARMVPSEAQSQMDAGLRAIRHHNCAACHVIEPGMIEFVDDNGHPQIVRGDLMAFDSEVIPPALDRFEQARAVWESFYEEDLEEVIVRVLDPTPEMQRAVGDSIILHPDDNEVRTSTGWGGDFVDVVTHYYINNWDWSAGYDGASMTPDPDGGVRDVDGEYRLYNEMEYNKLRYTFAPPYLTNEGSKVQRDWFVSFLLDPYPIRPQMRVVMPSFNLTDDEAAAIADYFAYAYQEQWASRYAKLALLELGQTPEEFAEASGMSPAIVAGILGGSKPDTIAKFSDFMAYAESQGFEYFPNIEPTTEVVDRRAQSHIEEVVAAMPDHFAMAADVVLNADTGVNCLTCHFLNGVPPLNGAADIEAWAPDLARVRERLREDWSHEWLRNPATIYPNTAMPRNFDPATDQWQEAYPGTAEEQIEAVMDWLYNVDRPELVPATL